MKQLQNQVGDIMEELVEYSDVLFAMAESVEHDTPDELVKHAESLRAVGYELLRLKKELGDERIWPRNSE